MHREHFNGPRLSRRACLLVRGRLLELRAHLQLHLVRLMTLAQFALVIFGLPSSVGMVWAGFTIESVQED